MIIMTGFDVKSRGGIGTCVQRYSPWLYANLHKVSRQHVSTLHEGAGHAATGKQYCDLLSAKNCVQKVTNHIQIVLQNCASAPMSCIVVHQDK